MFVLDSNVVSELRKVRSGKANRGLADWASSVPSSWLFLSSIVVHELEHGVLLAERSDAVKGAVLRRWLDTSVAAAFDTRILAVDVAVAKRAASLQVPDPPRFESR